jgi:hypothetical protein
MEPKRTTSEIEPPPDNVRGRMIAIGVYVALSIGLYFVLAPAMADQEKLASHLEAAGVWGVVAYIGLYVAQMFIPWLPGAPWTSSAGDFACGRCLLSSLSPSGIGYFDILAVRRSVGERFVPAFGSAGIHWRLVKVIRRQPGR